MGEKIEAHFKGINEHITLDRLEKIALSSVLQMPWTRSGFKELYDVSKQYYNLIYNSRRNIQVYADILKIDNYYKSFINQNHTTTYPAITRNARTVTLAAVTFASLFMQKGIQTDIENPDSDSMLKKLQTEILSLDRIIVNKRDNEYELFINFFLALSDDVLAVPYEAAQMNDPDIAASNFLKKKDVYFKCLRRLRSKLSTSSDIKNAAEKLFKNN